MTFILQNRHRNIAYGDVYFSNRHRSITYGDVCTWKPSIQHDIRWRL